MFTNPFNKKYQDGGSAPTDEQKKEMQGFVTWIKSNVEGFKDKSEQEIAKSLSDMAKSDEGKKSVQDLYSRYQKSKKQKSKFEDGGKFQSFICKHGHGGVNCGCGGGKVVRGAEGMEAPGNPYEGWTILPRQWKNNPDGSTQAIQVIVSPDGNTGYQRIITDRSQMGDRNGMAVRDTVYGGGAYGDGKVWVDASQNLTPQEKAALDEYLDRKVRSNQKGGFLFPHRELTDEGLSDLINQMIDQQYERLLKEAGYDESNPNSDASNLARSVAESRLGWNFSDQQIRDWQRRRSERYADEAHARGEKTWQDLFYDYFGQRNAQNMQNAGSNAPLTRSQALTAAEQSMSSGENRATRAQARLAYRNAKIGLRNNSDLRGRELRQAAREMIAKPRTGVSTSIIFNRLPSSALIKNLKPIGQSNPWYRYGGTPSGTYSASSPEEVKASIQSAISQPVPEETVNEEQVPWQNGIDLSHYSFNDAFSQARKAGLQNFMWKGGLKGTKLASEVNPKPATSSSQPTVASTVETQPQPLGLNEVTTKQFWEPGDGRATLEETIAERERQLGRKLFGSERKQIAAVYNTPDGVPEGYLPNGALNNQFGRSSYGGHQHQLWSGYAVGPTTEEHPVLESGGILKGENGLSKAAGYYRRHANEGIIRKLQMFLTGRGYYDGDFTGKFDNAFYNAVKNYQRDNGLVDDGMWGEDTNEVHRVLGAGDTTFNGSRSGAHPGRHTYGDNFVNRSYQTASKVSYGDINRAIERAISDPEWFMGDTEDAKNWRILFMKKNPDGSRIFDQIYDSDPEFFGQSRFSKKLPTNLAKEGYINEINTARDNVGKIILPTIAAPIALANPLATATSIGGGLVGASLGRNVGSDMKRAVLDENGNLVGYQGTDSRNIGSHTNIDTPLITPDQESNGEVIGGTIGAIAGSAVPYVVESLGGINFDPRYNPTGIEMRLGEPRLKEITPKKDWRLIKPKGGGNKRPGAAQNLLGKPAQWIRRMTGEPIKDSEISGYILEKCGGKIEKHQQDDKGTGIIGTNNWKQNLVSPNIRENRDTVGILVAGRELPSGQYEYSGDYVFGDDGRRFTIYDNASGKTLNTLVNQDWMNKNWMRKHLLSKIKVMPNNYFDDLLQKVDFRHVSHDQK